MTGKYLGEVRAPRIRGRAAGRAIELALPHDGDVPEHSFIPSIWARLRIADLADRQAWINDPYSDLAREIKDTALAYGLMSDYTAFVAVDASRVTEGDRGTTVFQGVPVPEGVRYETTVNR